MRNLKHNPKIPIIAGVLLLIGISVVVFHVQDMQTISRISVKNQKIVINNGETGITNTQVGMNNKGSINNQNTGIDNRGNFNNTQTNINNNGYFQNQGTNLDNQGQFNNTGGNINNQGQFGTSDGSINNKDGFYGSSDSNIGNYDVGFGNQNYQSGTNQYKYQNIDWGTWKSNFVNRILDDSMYIKNLDTYGLGTWFYYSFNVTNDGRIQDVTVFSFFLSAQDKKQIRDLIRSYAYQPITVFPKDSQRKKAKVKAIMLLGDSESKSDASNFNDVEKVKIKY